MHRVLTGNAVIKSFGIELQNCIQLENTKKVVHCIGTAGSQFYTTGLVERPCFFLNITVSKEFVRNC